MKATPAWCGWRRRRRGRRRRGADGGDGGEEYEGVVQMEAAAARKSKAQAGGRDLLGFPLHLPS